MRSWNAVAGLSVALTAWCAKPALAEHHFHATAFAIGGAERATVGSVVMAPAGGHAESVVADYDDGFLRFWDARSRVSGRERRAERLAAERRSQRSSSRAWASCTSARW